MSKFVDGADVRRRTELNSIQEVSAPIIPYTIHTHARSHVLSIGDVRVLLWAIAQLRLRGFLNRLAFCFRGDTEIEESVVANMLSLADAVMDGMDDYTIERATLSVERIQVNPYPTDGEPTTTEISRLLAGTLTVVPSARSLQFLDRATSRIVRKLGRMG